MRPIVEAYYRFPDLSVCNRICALSSFPNVAWISYPQRVQKDSRKKPKTSERELIERIRQTASQRRFPALRLGIGDDCALLKPPAGHEIAVTTDLNIDGRHFRQDWHEPELIGHRTLARGLSDLAAMGARPMAAFLSLALPGELTKPRWKGGRLSWMERFYAGLFALADANLCPLAGGDLSEAPLAVADIILTGIVPAGTALRRSTARPGDLVCVTGNLGGGVAALYATRDQAAKHPERFPKIAPALAPRLAFSPRLKQGSVLRSKKLATAAMDLSDGLSMDLARLCKESGVAAEVDAALLPIHPSATLVDALHGGDDYELLFTTSAKTKLPKAIAGVPLTVIGKITKANSKAPLVTLVNGSARTTLEPLGWEHFSG